MFTDSVDMVMPNVTDLSNGRLVSLFISLTLEHNNLGVDSSFSLSKLIFSNPWSKKETSLPPALVPDTVLICVVKLTKLFGIRVANWGIIVSNW